MNNIYLPDGFPNTPDVKDLGGQYTAGDGIAIGSDGSISVDYGPGVTMTSVDKLTIDYGPGLDMTTTDKLTIKAGNGLQLSGEELAARIGNGLAFAPDGAIKVSSVAEVVSLYNDATLESKAGDAYIYENDIYVTAIVDIYNITGAAAAQRNFYMSQSDYDKFPSPLHKVSAELYDNGSFIGTACISANAHVCTGELMAQSGTCVLKTVAAESAAHTLIQLTGNYIKEV